MTGVPLLLLHGYPFAGGMWRSVAEKLPDQQLLTPNLPGFGGLPVPPGEPSLETLAEQVLRPLAPKRFILAGFSMGGYVALAIAEKYPEKIAGLALISTQVGADTEEARTMRRGMIEKVRRGGVDAATEAAMPKMFANAEPANPGHADEVRRGAALAGVEGIVWALEAMARRPDRARVLESLKVPITIIHGAKDRFIPVAKAEELASKLPHSHLVKLPEAGHATPLEAPHAVADALLKLAREAQFQEPMV